MTEGRQEAVVLDAKLAALSKEYRPSMDGEVLHSWAFETADVIRAYLSSKSAPSNEPPRWFSDYQPAIKTDDQVESELGGNAGLRGAAALAAESLKSVVSVRIGSAIAPAKPAVPDVAAKIIARTMCVMECENPDDRCPGKDGAIAARWEHRLIWAKTALDAALPHIIPAKPAVEVVEATGIPFDLIEKVENRIAYRIALGSTPRAIAEDVLQIAALQAPATPDAQTEVEK